MVLKAIGIIVIVLAIVIVIYSFFRKTPEKYYSKAKNCHKKGEKYYTLGDSELAKDYYEEAEFYRQKAEEIKNAL